MDIILGALCFVFFSLWIYSRKQAKRLSMYDEILDIDDEISKKEQEIEKLNKQIKEIKLDYHEKRKVYDKLKESLAIYEEQMDMADMGIYTPHFDFGTSENYKNAIKENKDKQKNAIKSGVAVILSKSWTVNGSVKEGAKMMRQSAQLIIRSFNSECDVAIANTTWKNVNRMQERIKKSFDTINKFNQSNQIYITDFFLDLKLEELRLVYEYKLKIQEEKEKQAELRRQEREEEQIQKEMEKALKEEQKLQELLEKVQQRADHADGDELKELQKEILRLGGELRDIQRENSKVKAMAQQTKLGYVYVISNIGSFGKNFYKIGMTRRLDPMDRVRELGDASVPFAFDVHAMIFSENAPALEAEIQRAFAEKRVNLVNHRKEFFNVSLDEIKKVVLEFNADVNFIDEIEAQEYNETLRLRNKKIQIIDDDLPDTI